LAAAAAVFLAALAAAPAASAAEHRIGGGIHYWRTLDDLEDEGFDLEEDGTAYVVSYQFLPAGIFRFELGVEYFPEEFGGADEEVFSPQAFVLVGHGFYAGVGVGVLRSSGFSGDDVSDPFYAVRGGFELTLIPRLHLDLNANYRADAWNALEDVEIDTLTLGAQVRIGFGARR
jgi:hypothetical protein